MSADTFDTNKPYTNAQGDAEKPDEVAEASKPASDKVTKTSSTAATGIDAAAHTAIDAGADAPTTGVSTDDASSTDEDDFAANYAEDYGIGYGTGYGMGYGADYGSDYGMGYGMGYGTGFGAGSPVASAYTSSQQSAAGSSDDNFFDDDEPGEKVKVDEVLLRETLEIIRPSLIADGGDMELVGVDDDGVVTLRLTGACMGCPLSSLTLGMGIERILRDHVPGVTRVEAIM